jgi:hypothetical protein
MSYVLRWTAGNPGARCWGSTSACVRRLIVPALRPGDKDLCDDHVHGGDVRAWFMAHHAYHIT